MKKMESHAEQYLSFSRSYIKKIDASMRGFFKQKIGNAGVPVVRELYGMLQEYCIREGKRVRPLVLIISCSGYSRGKLHDSVVQIAAAIEMMHSFLLIQDDVVDRSDLRRGGKSLHVTCDELFGTLSHNALIGNDVALTMADVLFANALEMINNARLPSGKKGAFMKIFSDTYEITAWGQILDILNSQSRRVENPSATALQIATLKTAYYTIYYPMLMGYALSGKNVENERKLIKDFSLPLGLAFQLKDDILGVFGMEEVTGKPADSDIMEGKITLLVGNTLDILGQRERKKFMSLFTAKHKTARDIATIRKVIESSGAREAVVRKHRELIDESRMRLDHLSMKQNMKLLLGGLIELIEKM